MKTLSNVVLEPQSEAERVKEQTGEDYFEIVFGE